ncbi:MAG: glutathione S-transferase [Candidatus Azotimanducaceae bacterium]|jgi:glutathione S-transferase
MKFYYFAVAPNPTRVRTYIREKDIDDIEMVPIELGKGEHRSEAHLKRNPAGTLPVLELDSGEFITESLTIMEYLEALYPHPPMIGEDLLTRTMTLQAERKIELNLQIPIVRLIHATNSPLGIPKNPGIAESEEANLPIQLERIDQTLKDKEFVMGGTLTIADCTLFSGLFFGEFFGWNVPDHYRDLQRWYTAFKQRPSAAL